MRTLRIVKARTETPGEFRAADSARIPSPTLDSMLESVSNPTQVGRRIIEQTTKLQQRDVPTSVRPTNAPAPPSMTDYLKEKK